jgi:ComF family protein
VWKQVEVIFWDVFYPRRCFACHTEIPRGIYCPQCRALAWQGCEILKGPQLDKLWVMYVYENEIRELIHALKFNGKRALVSLVQEEVNLIFARGWGNNFQPHNTLVSGIPTDAGRLAARGFDLPESFFKECFRKREFFWEPVLQRVHATEPLFKMNEVARRKNLQGCFATCADVRHKHIIIVDDIFTTGATMKEAAATLKKAGAATVTGLAFAVVRDNLDLRVKKKI